MCAQGAPDACGVIGTLHLPGAIRMRPDRARALQFLTAECRLRGGDCDDVARDVKERFYARHLLAVSGYVGYVGDGSDENATVPVGGELGLLRLFGGWLPAIHKRGVVFGMGAGVHGEYANGRSRVGASVSGLLWTFALKAGYLAELDGAEAGRRDLRLDLVTSAPWAHAPLRLVFRLDVPIEGGTAGVRGGFLVELGWSFALDGRRPRLGDFAFPLAAL
jgi:hypothetical protein